MKFTVCLLTHFLYFIRSVLLWCKHLTVKCYSCVYMTHYIPLHGLHITHGGTVIRDKTVPGAVNWPCLSSFGWTAGVRELR